MNTKRKNMNSIIFLLFLIIVIGGFFIWNKREDDRFIKKMMVNREISEDETIEGNMDKINESKKEEIKKIFVHIAGEVHKPGVYELPDDSRVFDALNAAGGEMVNADL